MNKKVVQVLIHLAVGLAVSVAVMFGGGVSSAETSKDVLRIVCDGFFVSGALLLFWGGLRWTYNGGVMDGLGFSAKTVINRMRPHYEEHRQSFAEYRDKRQAKASSPFALVVSGLILLAVAVILFVIYGKMA